MTDVPRFALDDEEGFLRWRAAHPRALVLYRGDGCPYSATFEKVFLEEPVDGWARAIRLVEEGGHGPVAEALRVDITPTVDAFFDGREARLEGKLLLGITRGRFRQWARGLG